MLLTLAVSSVLMAGLWNLFTSYTRLFEAGQEIASESRLARAVLDQISMDVSGLADITPKQPAGKQTSSSASSGSDGEEDEDSFDATESSSTTSSSSSSMTSLPQFRLTGTSTSLRIHTYKPGPPRLPREEDEANVSLSSQLEEPEFFAPDLRVVLYDFTEPLDEEVTDDMLPVGLIRRELDWQSALALSTDEEEAEDGLVLEKEELFSDDQKFLSDSLLTDMEVDEIVAADLQNEQFLWVPEIVELQFRYSDGKVWSDSWDSQYRGALPVLIEISLEFDYEKGFDARYPVETEPGELTDAEIEANEEALDPEENLNDLLGEDEEEMPQYRRIIALKTAFVGGSSSSSSSSTGSNPETALSRLQSADDSEEEAP